MTNESLKGTLEHFLKHYGVPDKKAEELAHKFANRAKLALPKPEPDILVRHKGETVTVVLNELSSSKAKRAFQSYKELNGLKGSWEQRPTKTNPKTGKYFFPWEKVLKGKPVNYNQGSKAIAEKSSSQEEDDLKKLWKQLSPEEKKAILEDVMK